MNSKISSKLFIYFPNNYFVYLIIVLSSSYVHGLQEDSFNRTVVDISGGVNSEHTAIWMSNALQEALAKYTPESSTSSNTTICTSHGELYRRHLNNLTLWAVQMYDAGVRSVGGILTGDVYQLGHFDQCLNVSFPAYRIRGKYCLAKLKYGPTLDAYSKFYDPPSLSYFTDPPPNAIVWEKIKRTLDPRIKPRSEIYIGVCVPATCTALDVQNSINTTISTTFNKHELYGEMFLDEKSCYSLENNRLDKGFYIMQFVLILLFMIAVTATLYDFFILPNKYKVITPVPENKLSNKGQLMDTQLSKWEETFLAFSMRANMKELTSDGTNPLLDTLNGGKFICLFFIILGHRALYSLGGVVQNTEYWEESIINIAHMTFMNGTHLVDTFFIIGGFLTFLGVYGQLEKTKRFNLPMLIVFRWLRLMAPYATIMGIYALILYHIGAGPVWNMRIGVESENCRSSWWLNALFVNNYIEPEKQCLLMSWYLACDMHFFIIGACVVYALWKSPKYSEIIFIIILSISIMTPFIITYIGHHDGKLRLYLKLLAAPYKDSEFNSIYIPSHSRSIPYFFGILAGYIGDKMRKSNYTIPKSINYAGISLFFVAYFVQVYSLVLYVPGRPYSPLENAVFSSLLPLTWSIGSGWIIVIQYTTGLGFYNLVFVQKIYTPLSRLIYCAVLIHPAVQLVHSSANPSSEYITYPKLIWMTFGDVSLSFFLALFLYLLVEAPSRTMVKLWLQNGGKRRLTEKKGDINQQVESNGNNISLSDSQTKCTKDLNGRCNNHV